MEFNVLGLKFIAKVEHPKCRSFDSFWCKSAPKIAQDNRSVYIANFRDGTLARGIEIEAQGNEGHAERGDPALFTEFSAVT